MTDNEIIKALECCTDESYENCNECPYSIDAERCERMKLLEDILDLINHQKAEIERLKNENKEEKEAYNRLASCYAEDSEEGERIRQRLYSYENMFLEIGFSLEDVKDIDLKEIRDWKNRMIWHCKECDRLLQENKQLEIRINTAKSAVVREFAERLKRKIDVVYSIKNLQDNIDNLVKEMVDNEKGESKAMNKIFYLFIFADNSTYETDCAVSFKDAILEMAKNTGNSSDLFCKCLDAYKDDEIDEIIELFNHFCSYDYGKISKVYVIDRKIFDDEE